MSVTTLPEPPAGEGPDPASCILCVNAGAGCPYHRAPRMNPVALWDFLNLTGTAVLAAEGGDTAKAETALLEASLAAGDVFPAGGREAEALGIILEAAGRVTEEAL